MRSLPSLEKAPRSLVAPLLAGRASSPPRSGGELSDLEVDTKVLLGGVLDLYLGGPKAAGGNMGDTGMPTWLPTFGISASFSLISFMELNPGSSER